MAHIIYFLTVVPFGVALLALAWEYDNLTIPTYTDEDVYE